MQFKDIDHISEKDFSDVCQEYAKKHKNLTFCPAEWEWEAYPDVGFAILKDGNYTSITWGHHRYTRMSLGELMAEDCIIVSTPDNHWGVEHFIDTKEQLRELIETTFNIKAK